MLNSQAVNSGPLKQPAGLRPEAASGDLTPGASFVLALGCHAGWRGCVCQWTGPVRVEWTKEGGTFWSPAWALWLGGGSR